MASLISLGDRGRRRINSRSPTVFVEAIFDMIDNMVLDYLLNVNM